MKHCYRLINLHTPSYLIPSAEFLIQSRSHQSHASSQSTFIVKHKRKSITRSAYTRYPKATLSHWQICGEYSNIRPHCSVLTTPLPQPQRATRKGTGSPGTVLQRHWSCPQALNSHSAQRASSQRPEDSPPSRQTRASISRLNTAQVAQRVQN